MKTAGSRLQQRGNIMRIRYNICYVTQGGRVLLVNRERASWMGRWNGVGGKLEPGESPRDSMIRELAEETGLTSDSFRLHFKGAVTWTVDRQRFGGMYLYRADLREDVRYETPRKYDEGILDWKQADWIFHPDNQGVATNIPAYLPDVLDDAGIYDHHGMFAGGAMIRMDRRSLDESMENIERMDRYVMRVHGELARLDAASAGDEVRELLAVCMMPDEAKIARELAHYAEADERELWGYALYGKPAGLLGVRCRTAEHAVLLHVAVQPADQGGGIGRRMIEQWLKIHPRVQRLEAETDRDAVGFYRALGFRATSLGEKYPGVERFSCVWMRGSGEAR